MGTCAKSSGGVSSFGKLGACAKSGGTSSFSKIQIPLIRKVYPQLHVDKLVGVQPLSPGAAPPPQPAPEDIIGAVCLWLEETFEGCETHIDHKTGIVNARIDGGTNYPFHLTSDKIYVGSVVLFYEDPQLFDQLEIVARTLFESGFDGLDCLLGTLTKMKTTDSDPEDTNGSEGRIKVSDPTPQPASLIYYLRYRYAPTKKGKK